MRKPSAESFEIQDVRWEEGKAILCFSDFRLELSSYLFSSGYYYPGKTLSRKEVEELRERMALEKGRKKIELALSRGRKTRRQCEEILLRMKGLSPRQREEILSSFQAQGLIDDKSYALDFAKERLEKGYGRENVLAQLSRKGIPQDLLKSPELSELMDSEEGIPDDMLEVLYKKNTSQTIDIARQKMLQSLIQRGFPYPLAKEKVDGFFERLSPAERKKAQERRAGLLREKARKCYNQLLRTGGDLSKRKKKFFQKLSKDGFRYEEILSAWNENHEGGDYD